MKNLVAFYDACIVEPIETEETVYGNIIVPDMGKDTNTFGTVVAVGPGRYTITGVKLEPQVKIGDKVVLPTQGFTKLPFDGHEYYIGPENQVLAKVEETVEVEDILAETQISEIDEEHLKIK